MKRIILVLMLGLLFVPTMYAQNVQPKQITVNENDLPTNVLNEIKLKQEIELMDHKMTQYGKWVGVGGEVGQAIRDGLFAVKDVAVEFSDTKVGEFTMILIAWKVMGKDIVRIIVGLLFFIIAITLIWRSYIINFTTRKVRTNGRWWQLWVIPNYEIIKPDDDWDGYHFLKFLHLFLIFGVVGITMAVMFG